MQQALTSCEVSFELLEEEGASPDCKCLCLSEVRGATVQVPEGGARSVCECLCLSEVRRALVQVCGEGRQLC